MKGIIENFQGNRGTAWIAGEDGVTYFTHLEEFVNTKKVAKGNIVTFDIRADGDKPNLRAVNVKKVGHGPAHPFIRDAEQIIRYIETTPESTERGYCLRDLRTMIEYFKNVEDFEWCRTPRDTFLTR